MPNAKSSNSFKSIKFGRSDFPIQPSDTVTIKAEDEPAFHIDVRRVYGFTLVPVTPILLSDGMLLKKIIIVDHGFEVTHVNGHVFKSFTQNRDDLLKK